MNSFSRKLRPAALRRVVLLYVVVLFADYVHSAEPPNGPKEPKFSVGELSDLSLRVGTALERKDDAAVVTTAKRLLQYSPSALADFHSEVVQLLFAGQQAADRIKSTNDWVSLSTLQLEIMRAAIPLEAGNPKLQRTIREIAVISASVLGAQSLAAGMPDKALPHLVWADEEARALGRHPQQWEVRAFLGTAHVAAGQFRRGISEIEEAIPHLENRSPAKAGALVWVSRGYLEIEDWKSYRRAGEALLQLGIDSDKAPLVFSALLSQAETSFQAGDWVVAREIYAQTVAVLAASTNSDPLDHYLCHFGLAKCYTNLGEIEKATEALRRAKLLFPSVCSKHSVMQSNLNYAAFLSVESGLLETIARFDLALVHEQEREVLLRENPAGAWQERMENLVALIRLYAKNGDMQSAINCLARAQQELATHEPQDGGTHQLNLLEREAELAEARNDLKRAGEVRVQIVSLAEKQIGDQGLRYFQNLAMLAMYSLELGDSSKAAILSGQAQAAFIYYAVRNAVMIPFGEDASGATRSLMPWIACEAAAGTKEQAALQEAALVCSLGKEIHTEIGAMAASLRQISAASELRQIIREVERKSESGSAWKELVSAIERNRSAVRTVAGNFRSYGVVFDDIAAALPQDSCLIDFIEWQPVTAIRSPREAKPKRFGAFVSRKAAGESRVTVRFFDLGKSEPIDAAIETITKRMSAGQFRARDLAAALERLSQLVYAPLAAHLTNVSHFIVCPDGQLSRVPFEMLPVAPGGKYLIEERTISYVGSGREIVRLAEAQSPRSKVQGPKSAAAVSKSLVMGNPDFDLDLSVEGRVTRVPDSSIRDSQSSAKNSLGLAELVPPTMTKTLSRSYRGQRFAPLPGAGDEARAVAKLLGNDCVLRLGADAREAELKAVQSPRVLHLATHGFFLSDQEFKRTNAFNARGDFTAPQSVAPPFTARRSLAPPQEDWENPLVRCGIALAGANHFTNSALRIPNFALEDGLLTGLEASLLNLQGTELVILSACDSGTGEVKIGEGVMSLRRAFRIAGAESVLASHWKVSDQATSRLMTEFMRRWRGGEPRAQAWREAQLSLLRSKDFSNPYYWAAFTLTGQWR